MSRDEIIAMIDVRRVVCFICASLHTTCKAHTFQPSSDRACVAIVRVRTRRGKRRREDENGDDAYCLLILEPRAM